MARTDWTSKAARIRALERVIGDPGSSSTAVTEAVKELRRLTEPKRRQRSSPLSVDDRVSAWYAEHAPDVPAPRLPKGADPVGWEELVCTEHRANVHRAINRIVFRECCGGQAFECRCAAPVKSALET